MSFFINNLLFIIILKQRKNVSFFINIISGKIRQAKNKLNSFFDNTFGLYYFIVEKLKYQFHLLLHILSYNNINFQTQYSTTTKITLIESLMSKIRGKNFPIILELMKVFEHIKTANDNIINNDLFIFEHENYYFIKYINKKAYLY